MEGRPAVEGMRPIDASRSGEQERNAGGGWFCFVWEHSGTGLAPPSPFGRE